MNSSVLRSVVFAAAVIPQLAAAGTLTGRITDGETRELTAARLYIQSEDGACHHATSVGGTAVPYRVQRGQRSIEVHTTLSAHPFEADLAPGTYTLTVEKGKEYHPTIAKVTIGDDPTMVDLELRRWTETTLASRGWFSGDTHVHRKVVDLPVLLLAEDLNVGLPLTAWVTDSRQAPAESNKNPDPVPPAKLIEVDETHVIWPVNTEYEIFSVDGKRHTLGAVFVLNHREPLTLTAPPVGPIAAEARRQGAILDLDKHNWPWSVMLVPTMGVQLFELTNNHLWRTEFFFNKWQSEFTPEHFGIERDAEGYTERGWIDFGFRTYYALLNCGFDMKPSGGTASGVHPVPLGFGRVYVHLEDGFSYEAWMEGLAAGRSFVTTGPILVTEVKRIDAGTVEISGIVESGQPLGGIEIVVNGEVRSRISPQPELTERNSFRLRFSHRVAIETSSWVAVRAFEARADGRPRFAHSAPVHFAMEGKPLVPRKEDVDYLVKRVEDELERHEGVLPEEALEEYRKAAEVLRGMR